VSDHLGNTPAVARKSYVDTRLVDLFDRGVTIDAESTDIARADIRDEVERVTHDLLATEH
jgi:DNA topoisomerase-1